MAVDVYYSDNFMGMGMISPRLSFSRDLQLQDNESNPKSINNNDYTFALDSTFDFAFHVDKSVAFASSSADELFSDGKIIPTSLKTEQPLVNVTVQPQKAVKPCLDVDLPTPTPTPTPTDVKKKSLKEFLEDGEEEEEEEEPNNGLVVTKSLFSKFRRSNSLNNYCGSSRNNQRKGLIGSWKILSRSGSTGKYLEKIVEEEKPNYNNYFHHKIFAKFTRNNNNNNNNENVVISSSGLNRSSSTKVLRRSQSSSDEYFSKLNSDSNHFRRSYSTGSALKKQQSQKQQQITYQKGKVKDNTNSNSSIRGTYYYGNNHNNHNNNNNNSSKLSPMLNLPSPYISRVSVDLFGFGSLFCNGSNKDRKKRK